MQEYTRTGLTPRDDIADGRGSEPARPKAYSYVSSSTPEQAKDDSLRRQTEQAEAWAMRGIFWAMQQCVVAPQIREAHKNAFMATVRMLALEEKPMPRERNPEIIW